MYDSSRRSATYVDLFLCDGEMVLFEVYDVIEIKISEF